MKIHNILLGLIILAMLSACNKKEDSETGTSKECLGLPNSLSNEPSCEELVTQFADQICSAVDLGAFSLLDNSLDFMPDYCNDLNDKITFVNSSGEKVGWQITQKTFLSTRSLFSTSRRCSPDSTKIEAYCFKGDLATIALRNEETLRSMILQMGVLVQEDMGQENGVGDALFIVREVLPNQFQAEFNAVITQGSLDFESYSNEEFYSTINLNGVTFENVISNIPPQLQQPPFTYYYTKNEGLIGYKDLNGEIWVIE